MNQIEINTKDQNPKITINSITDSFVKRYGRYSNSNTHDEELDKLSSEIEIRMSPEKHLLSSSKNFLIQKKKFHLAYAKTNS
jgi:hypothetical protein